MSEEERISYLEKLARGEKIETRHSTWDPTDGWESVKLHAEACQVLVRGLGPKGDDDGWQFRVASNVVKVTLESGEVLEVPAPMKFAPEEGTIVWYVNTHGTAGAMPFIGDDGDVSTKLLNLGRLFASPIDAMNWAQVQNILLGVDK